MPPLSGKQRKTQLKLKRAVKRGDAPPQRHVQQIRQLKSSRNLQSQFVKLDKGFLDDTRALAGSIALRRPIPGDVVVLRPEWITPTPPKSQLTPLTLPRRPKWRYQMSKDELDANEQAYFRTWLAQQDAIVEQWQRALNAPSAIDYADPAGDRVGDSETQPNAPSAHPL
ncbi:hypothetical protein JVU11DRAFT_4846 [Chiua virens]|nr:hypothetical protein JVU11DRAFT_4846 [Chiua virens]